MNIVGCTSQRVPLFFPIYSKYISFNNVASCSCFCSAILHDKAVYNNPDDFHPERFAPSEQNPGGEPDPARAVFGFGRRICPGRFFADDSLWLTIASTLHLVCILKPADAAETKVTWASGLVRCVY